MRNLADQKCYGLTLNELVVLLSAIMIISMCGVLYWNHTCIKRKELKCLSNLNQIYGGSISYADDFQGVFPMNFAGPKNINPQPFNGDWTASIGFYSVSTSCWEPKGPQMELLPTNAANSAFFEIKMTANRSFFCAFSKIKPNFKELIPTSYGVNNQVSGYYSDPTLHSSRNYTNVVKQNTVLSPATTIYAADARKSAFLNFSKNPDLSYLAPSSQEKDLNPRHRVKMGTIRKTHSTGLPIIEEDWSVKSSDAIYEDVPLSAKGGTGLLFVDGHAETLSPNQWHLLTNHNSKVKWHPD